MVSAEIHVTRLGCGTNRVANMRSVLCQRLFSLITPKLCMVELQRC